MLEINATDIAAMDKFYRTQLINSLSGYKSANLIATVDAQGQTNLAIFSSAVHLGADPPLMGLISRPYAPDVFRHSLDNMKAQGQFTMNAVHEGIYQQAHQTSARYPKAVSEFEACGLTPFYYPGFAAPAVAEAKLRIGLRFLEAKPIEQNGTFLIIGQIEWINLPAQALAEDGHILHEALQTLAITGLDSYHKPQLLQRLPRAKVK